MLGFGKHSDLKVRGPPNIRKVGPKKRLIKESSKKSSKNYKECTPPI